MLVSVLPKALALIGFMLLSTGCALANSSAPLASPTALASPPANLSPTPCLPWAFPNIIAECPTGVPRHYEGSTRRFERGFVIWLSKPDMFYIFFSTPEPIYFLVAEPYTWQMGEPNIPPAPSGFYAPSGGFDFLWRGAINIHIPQYSNLRERLGWSTEGPERLYATDYQCVTPSNYWQQHCLMLDTDGRVIVLRPSRAISPAGTWQAVESRK